MLCQGARKIACEISVSTSVAHELENVKKCLDAGYQEIWVICDETTWISSFQKKLKSIDKNTVRVFTSEEVVKYIQSMPMTKSSQTVGGRVVVPEMKDISEQENERREIVLAKILTKSF